MDSWPAPIVPHLPGRAPETRIWDTASKSLADAAAGPVASLYACGITPYDATHMGHAATYLAWDLLNRTWRDSGHEVRYAQNVTDVDDPLLERADRDGEDWRELAQRETQRYRTDMTALRVLPPDHLIGAVEALDVIGEFSALLADRGALYELDADVYGYKSADPRFGAVSGYDVQTMLALSAERGGDPGRAGKKDPLDPRVWLAQRPGEPHWDSRFGPGRPGWHVECAAIAWKYLGISFDVQAGGSDLIFPHHEMSASHARVALADTGSEVFARRYAHSGMVRYQGEKMSKSLGNLVFVSKLREAGVDPMAIRLAVLAHHYRSDWDWTDEVLQAATERLARWRAAVSAGSGASAGSAGSAGSAAPAGSAGSAQADAEAVLAGVRERMADDLDAPGALAVVDAWVKSGIGAAGSGAAPSGAAASGAAASGAAKLVSETADALLGVSL